jgi:glycerol-3-phosphate dehydrogenase (NAD(P)+)
MAPEALVLGNGGFGTALALVLAETGHEVTIWGHDPLHVREAESARENRRFLPGVPLPAAIRFTTDLGVLARPFAVAVNAIPTRYLRSVVANAPRPAPRTAILSTSKGIEADTRLRPTQILHEVFPRHPVAVLSGPSHAEEVARRSPTSVVVASRSPALTRRLQRLLATERFRVYASDDIVGVETAGALKNVIALAAGILDGLGFGDNSKSALVTRGLVEIARLGRKLGARLRTFYGLAGVGDLITTCFSRHGRNRAVGERLGRGEPLDSILAGMEMVAEGVTTARAALALARHHHVEMPITREVAAVLFEGRAPADAIRSLMTRASKHEHL